MRLARSRPLLRRGVVAMRSEGGTDVSAVSGVLESEAFARHILREGVGHFSDRVGEDRGRERPVEVGGDACDQLFRLGSCGVSGSLRHAFAL
jgi:hypothetical protein